MKRQQETGTLEHETAAGNPQGPRTKHTEALPVGNDRTTYGNNLQKVFAGVHQDGTVGYVQYFSMRRTPRETGCRSPHDYPLHYPTRPMVGRTVVIVKLDIRAASDRLNRSTILKTLQYFKQIPHYYTITQIIHKPITYYLLPVGYSLSPGYLHTWVPRWQGT